MFASMEALARPRGVLMILATVSLLFVAQTLEPPLIWTYEANQQAANLGFSVSTAGDVNGDTIADIVVGAPRYTLSTDKDGAAFLFLGKVGGPEDMPSVTVSSGQKGSDFGAAVAGGGDVNGDGFDDLLVGAPNYKSDQGSVGAAFIYFGASDGPDGAPDWSHVGLQSDGALGISVAVVGDVNRDGIDDIVVGADHQQDSYSGEGRAFFFFGSPSGPAATADWVGAGGQAAAGFGAAVAPAGDVNRDGYDDFLIGSPGFDDVVAHVGAVFAYYGGPEGPKDTPDWQVLGPASEAWFGRTLASAGDVNGDGFDDILVGASHQDVAEIDEGAVYLYLGGPTGLAPTPAWSYMGAQSQSWLGQGVAGAGDVNDDGYDDVLVGAPRYSTTSDEERGTVLLFLGLPAGLETDFAWSAFGSKALAWLGYSLSGVGDVSTDGIDDMLAGAPQYRGPEDFEGRAELYLGVNDPGNDPDHWVYLPSLSIGP